MADFHSAPPYAGFGRRAPSSAPTEQAQYPLAPHVPTQRTDDFVSDIARPLWEKVVREYTHILQESGQTFYEQFCSRVNATEPTLRLAKHDPRLSLLRNFRSHCDLWEEAVFSAVLSFVQPRAGTQDNPQNIDRRTLFKAWREGEIWWDTMISPGHLSSLYSSNYRDLFKKLIFELAKIAAVLKGDIAPSIAAITDDESPLSHLTVRTEQEASTHDGTWTTIHSYATQCRQKCDSVAENLDRFVRDIESLIRTLEEWKAFAISLGTPSHVQSAHGHSQMNEVLRNTEPWIRGVRLTVKVLSIAHSTAGKIAYDLVNRGHSDERVYMGVIMMDAAPDRYDHNVVGQDDMQVNSSATSYLPPSSSDTSGFGPPLGVIVQDKVTDTQSNNEMETSFEMNMANALTGNGLKDPDEAAFNTTRNRRKLGEDHKQMKAAVHFNDKLGQLQKAGQVTVWTPANQVHMSRPRKPLLSAVAHAIMRGIGVTKDETITGPEERYIIMATSEPFDLKSVVFKSAKLSPCLKVIKVQLDWPDDTESTW